MKIAIHSNQFDGRGTGKVPYDYGIYLQKYLNCEIIFITAKNSKNEGLKKIKEKFNVELYDNIPPAHQSINDQLKTKKLIETIIERKNINFLHMLKSGENDNITPENCKTGIHCIFNMMQPHGNIYAGVSEYLSKKFNKKLYVPHIINPLSPSEDYRLKYNIPKEAFVIGRHGGYGQFNIPFVKNAIVDILKHRTDIYFLFLSTEKFIDHERIIHIPWVESDQDIFNFINSCDCMIHAREDGETFGLAVAEFSASNKPIITWSGLINNEIYQRYDKCHLELLGDRAIIYNDYQDLLDTFYSIDKSFISQYNWDKYSEKFSPENVINTYVKTFLL